MNPDNIASIFFMFLSLLYSKDYILDTCSVERNYILVKTYLLGGENERVLPGRTLTEVFILLYIT